MYKPKGIMPICPDPDMLIWHSSVAQTVIVFKQLFTAFAGRSLEGCSLKAVSVGTASVHTYESHTFRQNPSPATFTTYGTSVC